MGLFGLNDAAQQAANTPAAQQASNIITAIADASKNIIGAVTAKPGMPPVNSTSGGSGGGYSGFSRGSDLWLAVGGVAVVVGIGYYLMHHKSGGGAARRASQSRAYARYRAYRRR